MNPSDRSELLSNKEFICRILKGEARLCELLIHRYSEDPYSAGRAYNYNNADTEDLMLDTFGSAYMHLSTFKNRSSLFLLTILMLQQ